MRDIFSFFLRNNIVTCYKEVLVAILSLSFIIPKIFLLVLVFFVDLVFVGKRLLGLLSTRYVRKKILTDLFFIKSLFSFFTTSLYFQKHLALISQMLEDSCSNVFAFILIVFLTTLS